MTRTLIGRLAELHLVRSEPPHSGTSLQLMLRPDTGGSTTRLTLERIADLQLRHLDADVVLQLEIRDVTSDGLEGLRFRVVDAEEGVISCWCGDVTMVVD